MTVSKVFSLFGALLAVSTVTLVGSKSPAAEFALFPTDPQLSAYIQQYHLSPNPEAALDRLATMDVKKLVANERAAQQPHARAILTAFYVQIVDQASTEGLGRLSRRLVAERDAGRLWLYIDALSYSSRKLKSMSIFALGLTPEVREKISGRPDNPYPGLEINHPQMMDIIWGAFFGSGDKHYVERIARHLKVWEPFDQASQTLRDLKPAYDRGDPAAQKKVMDVLLAQAAFQSLSLVASKSYVVRETLINLSKTDKELLVNLGVLLISLPPFQPGPNGL